MVFLLGAFKDMPQTAPTPNADLKRPKCEPEDTQTGKVITAANCSRTGNTFGTGLYKAW
jgi:hypothetical protein